MALSSLPCFNTQCLKYPLVDTVVRMECEIRKNVKSGQQHYNGTFCHETHVPLTILTTDNKLFLFSLKPPKDTMEPEMEDTPSTNSTTPSTSFVHAWVFIVGISGFLNVKSIVGFFLCASPHLFPLMSLTHIFLVWRLLHISLSSLISWAPDSYVWHK